MGNNKIKVGITHGDVNGIGYEIILKTFAEPTMFDFCTPIVYGSPKVATYHRKAMDIDMVFSIINNAKEADAERLNILPCVNDELKVEMGRPSIESGQAALDALRRAVSDYKEGFVDVLVTTPINMGTIQSADFHFTDQSAYMVRELRTEQTPINIYVKDELRVALITDCIALREIPSMLTKKLLKEKISAFHHALVNDFGVYNPRIAILSLNPYAGLEGLLGKEEGELIVPAIKEMMEEDILCFGPYAVDSLVGSGNYALYDGILAMYHDQGLALFKALTAVGGVEYTAGLPIVYASPTHGVAYDIAGKGEADESAMRNAVYLTLDIFRHRNHEEAIHANPLKKQYFDKRDDSYRLKLDSSDDARETL
ncbi:PdxA family dehydrogenase [Phocaeicola abscessus]|uniref:PdxA family dehydrogenase n=1 Tax=Phocaeicola abscessus TaxID=555313 RepID=UPI0004B6F0D8|nr:4-hydroxythreonine-4-phosphate dehydrogenase PdxA [Phocaeicola abscessus]